MGINQIIYWCLWVWYQNFGKEISEITGEDKISVDDLLDFAEQKIEETKGKIKIYKDIIKSKNQILLNRELVN